MVDAPGHEAVETHAAEEDTNAGIEIRLALGTAQWNGCYGINNHSGPPDEESAKELLALARRSGIDTLDTARGYGESESLIGQSITAMDCAGDFTVVTKLHPDIFRPGSNAAEAIANTERSLANSRAALQRDELDVVLLHRVAHLNAGAGAVWEHLLRERDAGAIGALGVSAANPNEAWSALENPDVAVLQVPGSLLDQRLARAGFFEAAEKAGKGIYLRSVFLQGLAFMTPRRLPNNLGGFAQPLAKIRGMATGLQCGIEQLFLAYAATLPGCTAVVGCESVAQLRGIVAAVSEPGPSLASVRRLARRIPVLPDRLLDPSQWNLPVPPAAPGPKLAESLA